MRFPGRFPLTFGGHDTTQDIEHQALLDALAPGWDVEEDTELWIETRVDALAITMIWSINRRASNQGIPTRMMDALEDWETALNMRPSEKDTLYERRQRLAAKLRAVSQNTIGDIIDVCSAHMGDNFETLVSPAEDDWISYWPGVNPGPPSYEYASNRAHVCVHCNKDRMTDGQFIRVRSRLIDTLSNLLPSWMTFTIGVGTGIGTSHTCNVGIVGQTII